MHSNKLNSNSDLRKVWGEALAQLTGMSLGLVAADIKTEIAKRARGESAGVAAFELQEEIDADIRAIMLGARPASRVKKGAE